MDRNPAPAIMCSTTTTSLSARRAWIEMSSVATLAVLAIVALRKESVDRNTSSSPASLFDLPSLSARRAWIEIANPP